MGIGRPANSRAPGPIVFVGPGPAQEGRRRLQRERRHRRLSDLHHQGQPAHRPVRVRGHVHVPQRRPGRADGGHGNEGPLVAGRGPPRGRQRGIAAHGQHHPRPPARPLGGFRDRRRQRGVPGALPARVPRAPRRIEQQIEHHHPRPRGDQIPQHRSVQRAGPGEDAPVGRPQLRHAALVDLHQRHPAGDVPLAGAEDGGVCGQLLQLGQPGEQVEGVGEGADPADDGGDEQTEQETPALARGHVG